MSIMLSLQQIQFSVPKTENFQNFDIGRIGPRSTKLSTKDPAFILPKKKNIMTFLMPTQSSASISVLERNCEREMIK